MTYFLGLGGSGSALAFGGLPIAKELSTAKVFERSNNHRRETASDGGNSRPCITSPCKVDTCQYATRTKNHGESLTYDRGDEVRQRNPVLGGNIGGIVSLCHFHNAFRKRVIDILEAFKHFGGRQQRAFKKVHVLPISCDVYSWCVLRLAGLP